MHGLLYYPDFEIKDQNFLKFALLYIDEIRPIIPDSALTALSDSMKEIMKYTDLIKQYVPEYEDGVAASNAAIIHIENQVRYSKYDMQKGLVYAQGPRDYKLYSDKYSCAFENYCLENRFGQRCNEGLRLNRNVAYTYMSILADCISKKTQLDMITDYIKYADPVLLRKVRQNKQDERIQHIKRNIEFMVPVDLNKIPLSKFIELRADAKFNDTRRRFVKEYNKILDDEFENDLYNYKECMYEVVSLITKMFTATATVAVAAHMYRNVFVNSNSKFDLFGNAAEVWLALGELKKQCPQVKEYINKLEGKRQANRYYARLRRFGFGDALYKK